MSGAGQGLQSAVIAVARMENRYLIEWITYHLKLGFNHVFICDNNFKGEENISEFLNANLDSESLSRVTVFDHRNDGSLHRQMRYYSSHIWECKMNYDWVAVVDVDEFITLAPESGIVNINEFLSRPEFSNAGQVLLNWMVYGDNNLTEFDSTGVLNRFTVPASPKGDQVRINWHIKPVVNCRKLSTPPIFPCTHFMLGNAVTASGITCKTDAFQKPDYAVAYIRHYLTKSIREFMDRKVRGKSEEKNDGRAPIGDVVSWICEFFDINEMTDEKRNVAVSYLAKCYTAEELSNVIHECSPNEGML